MEKDILPFGQDIVDKIIAENGERPFYLYAEEGIRDNIRRLQQAFSWNAGYKNYYAVKACPNTRILDIMREEGCGADCSSLPELLMSDAVGITGSDIMFTSNETPAQEFIKASELGAIVNFDDITHIDYFKEHVGTLPEIACCRFNPGKAKEGNSIIGSPLEAKYGLTRTQLVSAYTMLKENGVKRFGLHTMVASNELNPEYFVETARILFETVVELSREVGIEFEFINIGGGIGIPYLPEEEAVDLQVVGEGIQREYERLMKSAGYELKIFSEMGRMITGDAGYLVTRVLHEKNIYKNYKGVDASMADLMRPGMYGAYHHIVVLGKEEAEKNCKYDIVGSLCENCDKFAVDRMLPKVEIGDYLAICDAGAHGYAMGFNYNAKLRPAEYLLCASGDVVRIRRAQTIADYFATLEDPRLDGLG